MTSDNVRFLKERYQAARDRVEELRRQLAGAEKELAAWEVVVPLEIQRAERQRGSVAYLGSPPPNGDDSFAQVFTSVTKEKVLPAPVTRAIPGQKRQRRTNQKDTDTMQAMLLVLEEHKAETLRFQELRERVEALLGRETDKNKELTPALSALLKRGRIRRVGPVTKHGTQYTIA